MVTNQPLNLAILCDRDAPLAMADIMDWMQQIGRNTTDVENSNLIRDMHAYLEESRRVASGVLFQQGDGGRILPYRFNIIQ